MSVALKCDSCGEIADMPVPAEFHFEEIGAKFTITALQGKRSLDYCKVCLASWLVIMANEIAPKHQIAHWHNVPELLRFENGS